MVHLRVQNTYKDKMNSFSKMCEKTCIQLVSTETKGNHPKCITCHKLGCLQNSDQYVYKFHNIYQLTFIWDEKTNV